ncbi:hypothetical protein KXD40_001422 [Peronospora effusa]|nr:hypothetical protein KXD40_001422 [Peronospora effusa]
MLLLNCAIVGIGGSAISIIIEEWKTVALLKEDIKAKKANALKNVDADQLRLFATKKDGAWLSSTTEDVKQLKEGMMTPLLEELTEKDQELQGEDSIADIFLENVSTPKAKEIHVLVVGAGDYVELRIEDAKNGAQYTDELTHFQQRGELIQRNCKDYCQKILNKIDALYTLSGTSTLPFICVEGSSGMGKSQLAFALGGSRPWFYWPVFEGDSCQSLYENFSLISDAFREVTNKDDPMKKSDENILNSKSDFYNSESLWTFGFIRALLQYCSKEQNQLGQMIRFQKKTSWYVEKCNRKKVIAIREKMKKDGKFLPFFVLDEMMPNVNSDGGGKNIAAFQRNVFRVCGLVVVVMGTNAKITNLVGQSKGSYYGEHAWMTVMSRFPSYQPIPFADADKELSWNRIQGTYPVLKSIVANSRGRFARYFADSAVQYAIENSANGIELCDLLDVAFDYVSSETQSNNSFMGKQEGRDAQLMAISYANVCIGGISPRPYKKRKVASDMGAHCMHLHFANLVDPQATEVDVIGNRLYVDSESWEPLCCFPDIEEDLLLYLAILGGKTYSGYYDRHLSIDYSTSAIFSMYLRGQSFTTGGNTDAISNDYKTYENMVAHMIFCASRRNGVQGIPFDEFFAGLLSECQDEKIRPVTMTIGNTKQTIVASDLLDKYADLAALSHSKIPFLAPPNAEWPRCILDTRTEVCNFGHLVRAKNAERCDIYVRNMEDPTGPPLFFCECKYWNDNVDSDAMETIIDGLEKVWKKKWAILLVFCLKLESFETEWGHKQVGCVKVNCRSGRVDWVVQPAEEKDRKKLVIVMETGPLTVGVPTKLD